MRQAQTDTIFLHISMELSILPHYSDEKLSFVECVRILQILISSFSLFLFSSLLLLLKIREISIFKAEKMYKKFILFIVCLENLESKEYDFFLQLQLHISIYYYKRGN
jgi:ABC-type antimicrobial peptide transport system permease subunit